MMKIQLLVAIGDRDYMEHLSRVLMEQYTETFEVSICSGADRLREAAEKRHFDVLLMDPALAEPGVLHAAALPLLLWDGQTLLGEHLSGIRQIRKYQRISTMIGEVLEAYAAVSVPSRMESFGAARGQITVVWSPVGGCGKTTVALAYAAQQVAAGKRCTYLDLENFSSTDVYFRQTGKSISTILSKLDHDVGLLLQSIRQQDNDTGIWYFCQPDNYDDISVLSPEDIAALVNGCARSGDEVVVDLSSVCDEKSKQLLEMADSVLLVLNESRSAAVKWRQFCQQNNIFGNICGKTVLVANRGAHVDAASVRAEVRLPCVQSEDPVIVFKTLSGGYFKG